MKCRVNESHQKTNQFHNHNHDNVRNGGLQLMPVRFEFTHPTAATASDAGTLNDWHPTTKPMRPSGNGRWLRETELAPGTYEYCLVVDGQVVIGFLVARRSA